MNNKTIIEFGFCILWRIMEISDGVIRFGQRPRRITPSSISIILHKIFSLIHELLLFSFKIFPRFWLAKSTLLIHHNQLLMTKFGRILCLTRKWRQKCSLLQVNEPLTEKTWGRGWVILGRHYILPTKTTSIERDWDWILNNLKVVTEDSRKMYGWYARTTEHSNARSDVLTTEPPGL